MKTKFKYIIRAAYYSFGGTLCAGAVMLIASGAQAQNLFVSGTNNIFEFTTNGVQSTFASGLNLPAGLAFNSTGDLFEADQGSENIYEFTTNGVQSTFASGLDNPVGLAFNSTGDLFEADALSGNIYEFTTNGVQSTFASGLHGPSALAFNSAGDLFEADAFSGNIYEFTTNGVQSTFASGFNNPVGLAFDSTGDLYVADFEAASITEITPGGVQSTFASDLSGPQGLAFDSAGDLFVVEATSGSIIEITPGGTQSTFASGLGGVDYLAFQGVTLPGSTLPVTNSPGSSTDEFYQACVNAVGISTNQNGNLTYQWFNNQSIICNTVAELGLTNPTCLSVVYDQTAGALDVVSGTNDTNYTVVATVLTFSGGVSLTNTNGTEIQLLTDVYWGTNPTIAGTLLAKELIPPVSDVSGCKRLHGFGSRCRQSGAGNCGGPQSEGFSLQGQLQFAVPSNGTNSSVIYAGSLSVGTGSCGRR
jgi:sugar lactone lactonase YvrE